MCIVPLGEEGIRRRPSPLRGSAIQCELKSEAAVSLQASGLSVLITLTLSPARSPSAPSEKGGGRGRPREKRPLNAFMKVQLEKINVDQLNFTGTDFQYG